MLRSDLCNFSDAYIVVKGNNVTRPYDDKKIAFKNNALFISCISLTMQKTQML